MKKLFKIGVFATLALALYSCEDLMEVDYPELSISFADNAKVDIDGVYQAYVGEDIIVNLSGDADIIYLYDGTPGYEYLTDDEICTTGGTAMVQFGSMLRYAPGLYQPGCLTMYVSNDFSGVYDSMNLVNATWIEIPESVHQGFDTVSQTQTFSNWVDMFDYIDKDSDYLYFAYQYKTEAANSRTDGLFGPAWYVRYFDFRRTYEDGRTQYYGLYDPNESDNDMTLHIIFAGFFHSIDWTPEGSAEDVYERNPASDGTAASLNYWRFLSRTDDSYDHCYIGPKTATGTYDYCGDLADDDWIISKEYDLKKAPVNDYAVSLKGTTTYMPESATVSYATAGEYSITVVAKNLTIEDEKIVFKRLNVKITDPS